MHPYRPGLRFGAILRSRHAEVSLAEPSGTHVAASLSNLSVRPGQHCWHPAGIALILLPAILAGHHLRPLLHRPGSRIRRRYEWQLHCRRQREGGSPVLVSALARSLLAEGGWYAGFRVGYDHVVVFAEMVFRYRRGDQAGRADAVEYGRTACVPDHQLDWPD
jgi:hypothetical protein